MKKRKFSFVARIGYLLAGFLIVTGATGAYRSDIVFKKDCSFLNIIIRGELKAGDSQRLERAFAGIAMTIQTILLNAGNPTRRYSVFMSI